MGNPVITLSPVLEAKNINVWYGSHAHALRDISILFQEREVTALIGPSGCGKSTLIRCFNRMNDLIPHIRVTGEVVFDGKNIYARGVDPIEVRFRIGMIFQKPNPFPKSIFDNVAAGPRFNKFCGNMADCVENALCKAALWDEVKDCLKKSALELSGGQQQRLCIARAIALEPDILLMDEPCSSLDPIATEKIEELIKELVQQHTVIIVTHNMQQAARVSQKTGFVFLGEIIEYGTTSNIFTNPRDKRTEDYITGRFG